jgi:hypothetical protein
MSSLPVLYKEGTDEYKEFVSSLKTCIGTLEYEYKTAASKSGVKLRVVEFISGCFMVLAGWEPRTIAFLLSIGWPLSDLIKNGSIFMDDRTFDAIKPENTVSPTKIRGNTDMLVKYTNSQLPSATFIGKERTYITDFCLRFTPRRENCIITQTIERIFNVDLAPYYDREIIIAIETKCLKGAFFHGTIITDIFKVNFSDNLYILLSYIYYISS